MHLYFKERLQKADSQQNRNFLIPQIDLYLNHAQDVFIHRLAEPMSNKKNYGFEVSQRIIDELRTLVVSQSIGNCIPVTSMGNNRYLAILPNDYMFYISGNVYGHTPECDNISSVLTIQQHDDRFIDSYFNKSDIYWNIINGTFFENGIEIYSDDITVITSLCLNYIRRPRYMHNAEDFPGGSYILPDGTTLLSGTADCELPEVAHNEIIDYAVMIAQGNLASPAIQYSQLKVNLANN